MSNYRPSNDQGCQSWEEILAAIEDGGSPPADHLDQCSECKEKSDLLQALAGSRRRENSGTIRAPCPDGPEWAALADGAVGSVGRLRMVEHLASCEDCGLLWRHLVNAAGAPEEDKWEVRESMTGWRAVGGFVSASSWWRMPWPLARGAAVIAAMLVLGVLMVIQFPPLDLDDDSLWRGSAAGLDVELDLGAEREPAMLSWRAFPGATSYRVRLWDRGGEQVEVYHVAAGDRPRLSQELQKGAFDRVHLWQVDAVGDDGVLASTGPVEVYGREP